MVHNITVSFRLFDVHFEPPEELKIEKIKKMTFSADFRHFLPITYPDRNEFSWKDPNSEQVSGTQYNCKFQAFWCPFRASRVAQNRKKSSNWRFGLIFAIFRQKLTQTGINIAVDKRIINKRALGNITVDFELMAVHNTKLSRVKYRDFAIFRRFLPFFRPFFWHATPSSTLIQEDESSWSSW